MDKDLYHANDVHSMIEVQSPFYVYIACINYVISL